MSADHPDATTARFRPGLARSENTWTVDSNQISKDGATFVALSTITSFAFSDLSTGRQQVAVFTLFTDDKKLAIQCNLGKRTEDREEFLRFVSAVLAQIERSRPEVRAKPQAVVSKWAVFMVGVALVALALFFVIRATFGDSDTRVLFYVFAGFAAIAGFPWLLGPPPWKSGSPATPAEITEFVESLRTSRS